MPDVTLIKFELHVGGETRSAGFTTRDKIEGLLSEPGTLGEFLRLLRDAETAEDVLLHCDPVGHRFFYFWCPNCATRVQVETSEEKIDDARDVDILPDLAGIPCPMCEHVMWSWDEVALRDESFMNRGTWADFARWRAGRTEPPDKAHVLSVPEGHLWEVADILRAGLRAREGGGTPAIRESVEQWIREAEEHLRRRAS